jgi:hypothetical protein
MHTAGAPMVTRPGPPGRSAGCRSSGHPRADTRRVVPGWRAQAVGRRFGRIVRTERRSRGPFSGLRAPPPADCRNAGIMQYCAVSAPRCRSGQRRGAAELGRLASGAVTPGEPGANRQPGRPRSPPQPAGATMRSSRRLRGRGAWRPSGPACHAHRPAHRPRPQGCSGVPARGEVRRAPVARSSGAYRPPACCTCLAVMPRLLAYCLGDGS